MEKKKIIIIIYIYIYIYLSDLDLISLEGVAFAQSCESLKIKTGLIIFFQTLTNSLAKSV